MGGQDLDPCSPWVVAKLNCVTLDVAWKLILHNEVGFLNAIPEIVRRATRIMTNKQSIFPGVVLACFAFSWVSSWNFDDACFVHPLQGHERSVPPISAYFRRGSRGSFRSECCADSDTPRVNLFLARYHKCRFFLVFGVTRLGFEPSFPALVARAQSTVPLHWWSIFHSLIHFNKLTYSADIADQCVNGHHEEHLKNATALTPTTSKQKKNWPVLGAPPFNEAHANGAHSGELVDRLKTLVDQLRQERREFLVIEDLQVASCAQGRALGMIKVWSREKASVLKGDGAGRKTWSRSDRDTGVGLLRNFECKFSNFSRPHFSEWPTQVKYRHYNI